MCIFIANEENSTFVGIGVDQLAKEGYMDELKTGPLFWVDAADSEPCVGTAGNVQWQLDFKGKLFHSGLPHRGINSIEFAMDAVNYIQKRFYGEYGPHPEEERYNFMTSSTMKPTQVSCAAGALNQLPPSTTVQGDIRLVPFYDIKAAKKTVEDCVAEINANPEIVNQSMLHGPHSKYVLPEGDGKGAVVLKWITEGENGIACDLESVGHKALLSATTEILGKAKHYSVSGCFSICYSMYCTVLSKHERLLSNF